MNPATLETILALPLIMPDNLREGDAILFHGTDFISRGIETFTNSPFSHTGLATYDMRTSAWDIIEATPPEVRETPIAWYLTNYQGSGQPYPGMIVVVRWSGITPDQQSTITKFALLQRSLGYDTALDADIAEYLVARIPMPEENGKQWICSELVQASYAKAGLAIRPSEDGVICVPNDIWTTPAFEAVGRLV